MSEGKRSRRRFLADALFLGGGLTATALLAKTQLGKGEPEGGGCDIPAPDKPLPKDIEPVPAGAAPMHPPEEPPQIEGEMEMPQADGNMVMPEPKNPATSPSPAPPNIRGRMKVSKPGEQP